MKNFTQNGNHHQKTDSSLLSNEQDSLISMIKDNNLYYLGYASGILFEIPKNVTDSPPKNMNIRMWTLPQLIRLQSDLINLAVLYDKTNESIQISQTKSFAKFFSELHEEELQQPLGYYRISTNPSESEDTFDENLSPVREKTPTLQEERRKESRRRHTSDRVKSLGRTEQATESQQEKMNKQDLIWDNTDIFMTPITNISKFSSVLAPSEPVKYPPTILSDPFGPHYSITIPQDVELFTDDPNKARLILPPPPSLDSRPKGVFAQMHTRLITALVNISQSDIEEYLREEESNSNSGRKDSRRSNSGDYRRSNSSNSHRNEDNSKSDRSNDNNNSNKNISKNKTFDARNYDLRRGQELINNLFNSNEHNNFINSDDDDNNNYSDDNNDGISNNYSASNENYNNFSTTPIVTSLKAAPAPTGLGITPYGLLEFDDKLKLELQSLEFTSSDLSMVYVDSPVSKNIEYRVMRQDELVKNTNKIKEKMSKLLQSRKEVFEEEVAYKKNWDDALRRFLDSQTNKQQQQQPQKQKKKKKTDS